MTEGHRGRLTAVFAADPQVQIRIRLPPLDASHLHQLPHAVDIQNLEGVLGQDALSHVLRQEDPGALLASGTGVWHPNIDRVQLKAGRTGWTFHFYLPASNEMATVIVSRGGTARLSETVAWETPPDLLDDQRWQFDSSDALADMLGVCNDALTSLPDAYVEAKLSTAVSNLTLLWQIDVISQQNPEANCGVNIDATTGIVRAR